MRNLNELKFAAIKLNTVDDVKRFVTGVSQFNEDISVTLVSDRWRINGRSILGIFSLDLSKRVEVEIEYSAEYELEADKMFQFVLEFGE